MKWFQLFASLMIALNMEMTKYFNLCLVKQQISFLMFLRNEAQMNKTLFRIVYMVLEL